MALKGTTKIELTNIHTGAVEVIEKDNLVTNAVGELVSLNPDGFLWDAGYNFSSNMLPLCPNAIGGIMLFENALEEDPAKYYAPSSNPLVGYSSNDVNTGADVKRGSMNPTESGKLEDNSGYRFVFDFTTSQANGTISALGLTSKWGGKSGYGSLQNTSNQVISLGSKYGTYENLSSFANWVEGKYLILVGTSEDYRYGYYAMVTGQNLVEVGKVRLQLSEISLSLANGASAVRIVESVSVKTSKFASAAEPSASSVRYYNFMDGGDGYIWGVEHVNGANGNSASPTTLNYIKIAKADFTFQEGVLEISAKLRPMGSHCTVAAQPRLMLVQGSSIIKDGYLYCMNYARTGVVRINLSNPSDVVEMLHPDGTVITPVAYKYETTTTVFNKIGNTIYFANGYIEGSKIIPIAYTTTMTDSSETSGHPQGLKSGKTPIQIGPYMVQYQFNYSSERLYRSVMLMTPYLATINNLDTPVTKTADKTMKITYILREE